MRGDSFPRDLQYAKFSAYGFLKNLRFFEPFLILFFLEKGLSYLEVGTLYAIREIAVNILEIPTGAIADALGRRRTMIASFVSYLISFTVFWLGASLPIFVVAMLLFSFGEAFRTGTHKAMIFTYLRITGNESHKADYYGHTRGWSQVGSAVSSAVAATIVFWSGTYASVFLFSTIPYVADLALMLTYPKELDGTRREFRWRTVGATFRDLVGAVGVTLRRPGAIRVIASAGYYSGFYKGTKDFLQPLVAALALSIPLGLGLMPSEREALLIGIVYTALYALTAAASRRAGAVARRLPSLQSAMNWELLAGLGLGAAVGVAAALSVPVVPVALFVLIYVVQNLRRPVGVSLVSETVDEEVLATLLSVESQLQSLLAAGTAFAVGAIAEALSSVGVGIATVSAVGLLLLPVLWIRQKESADRPDPSG